MFLLEIWLFVVLYKEICKQYFIVIIVRKNTAFIFNKFLYLYTIK